MWLAHAAAGGPVGRVCTEEAGGSASPDGRGCCAETRHVPEGCPSRPPSQPGLLLGTTPLAAVGTGQRGQTGGSCHDPAEKRWGRNEGARDREPSRKGRGVSATTSTWGGARGGALGGSSTHRSGGSGDRESGDSGSLRDCDVTRVAVSTGTWSHESAGRERCWDGGTDPGGHTWARGGCHPG